MRTFRVLLGTLLLSVAAASSGCRPAPAPAPATLELRRVYKTTATTIPLSEPKADEISVDQLALLLPRHPIVVGFDVDDTLVLSAPAFNALQPQYDPEVIRPRDYNALSDEQKKQYHEFWNKLNETYDDRSVPKQIGKRLLDLHLARGDDIWIISKRQSSVPETDACTTRYERMFGVKLPHSVVQTQLNDKTPFIAERHIDYYYGDADTDVTAAVTAGAVPIRVKRSSQSYSKDTVHNGQLGEIVLKDSDR